MVSFALLLSLPSSTQAGEAATNSTLSITVAFHPNSESEIHILNYAFAHFEELDYELLEIRDH